MRHQKRRTKLGMKSQHTRAVLANLVSSLIAHGRITTTIAKAKVARRHADKMVTLAKKADGTDSLARKVALRRQALAFLGQRPAVRKLFAELGKQHADRQGGYTRVVRLLQRHGDGAQLAILEWTGVAVPVTPAPGTKEGTDKSAKPAATGDKK
jgi:large subunit ribosomal protein L17